LKKGDLVKRVRVSKEAFYDDIPIDAVGVILRGPYEKNVTDVLYKEKPWLSSIKSRYVVLKRVVDIMFQDNVYKYCIADDYERVKL